MFESGQRRKEEQPTPGTVQKSETAKNYALKNETNADKAEITVSAFAFVTAELLEKVMTVFFDSCDRQSK